MEGDRLGLVRGGFFEKVVLGSTVNARTSRFDGVSMWQSFSGCFDSFSVSLSLFFFKGKDLGLAFEIPPHMKNQALFPACVLKVIEISCCDYKLI